MCAEIAHENYSKPLLECSEARLGLWHNNCYFITDLSQTIILIIYISVFITLKIQKYYGIKSATNNS